MTAANGCARKRSLDNSPVELSRLFSEGTRGSGLMRRGASRLFGEAGIEAPGANAEIDNIGHQPIVQLYSRMVAQPAIRSRRLLLMRPGHHDYSESLEE